MAGLLTMAGQLALIWWGTEAAIFSVLLKLDRKQMVSWIIEATIWPEDMISVLVVRGRKVQEHGRLLL